MSEIEISPSTSRHVTIEVVDADGRLIQGADIDFVVNATPVGGVRRSVGKASIVVPDPQAVVEARATVMLLTQTAQLPPGQDAHTFRFAQASMFKSFAPPEARCPDGSSGQPCVDCQIGGSIVRICS